MNNLFQAFTIKIPGQNLDDKQFYEYADFDSQDFTSPTDAQVRAKAVALVRMKQIKRKLSEYAIPIYFSISYAATGTASTIPTDPTLTVGYISYEPFISTLDPIPKFATEAEAATAAAGVIKTIIDEAMNSDIDQEFAVLQKLYSLENNPIAKEEFDYRELYMEYVDAPAVTVSSTVTHVTL